MQFKTMLHARPPRVECQDHGIKQATLPWAEKNSRFTLLFERFAIDVLQATQTVKGAQGILGTTWDETWHILRRFHIMKLANEAVDRVRRAEHKERKAIGDASLTGTRFIWLTGFERLSESQQERFDDLIGSSLETGKAWAYTEMLRGPWACPDEATALGFFQSWYKRVIHTKLEPMKKVARTIKERLANVVSSYTHGITSAGAEGINSKIMAIKRRVGGYRNRENFKTAISFYCGGLELYPH